jgi:hypothetical protein
VRFISDLLAVSKFKSSYYRPYPPEVNPYFTSLEELCFAAYIIYWLQDTLELVKRIGEKYDLRIIEQYCVKHSKIELDTIPQSFNYSFELSEISPLTKDLLGITEDHMKELERLPDDIIDILQICNGYGMFLKSKTSISTKDVPMQSYGDISKVKKFNFSMPWFKYKLALKDYSIETDSMITQKSDQMVLGYFLDSSVKSEKIHLLLKLLGTILLQYYTDKGTVTIYSFYGDAYEKDVISRIEDIVPYFVSPKQLKLFPINNSKALSTMIYNHPGSEIIFIPNIKADCSVPATNTCKINIISFNGARYNLKFSNLCRRTGGTFLSI